MSLKKLSIAIISDMHCHYSESSSKDTYLTSNMLRTDPNNHPVESILKTIKKEKIKVDLTLCPGDFTNKTDVQGFISGWDFTLEINNELKGKEVIATVGNHDVDSYETFSNYSFEVARGIKKSFPLKNEDDCDKFWSKGCVFIEADDYRILVINSSHYHYNKKSAAAGKVGDDLINYIDEYLVEQNDDKINIALAHHHPIDHSRSKLGEEDKIVNGDALLEILGKYKFDLFIHGHKHDPLLRYHNFHSFGTKIPILSSGSFSAISNLGFTSRRNTFHKIDLIKTKEKPSKGRITTWTFIPKNGWKIVNDDEGFDSYTGFGFDGDLQDIVDEIIAEVGNEQIKSWPDVVKVIPDIEYLTPKEAKQLELKLKDAGLILSGKLSQIPEIISNTKAKNGN